MKRAVYAIPAVGLLWTGCGQVADPRCGDGLVESGVEECDDGNDNNGDACTDACENARCGDGLTFNEAGGMETCDDANAVDTDGCTTDCQLDPVLRSFELTTRRNSTFNDSAAYQFCTASDYYGSCTNFVTCSRAYNSPLTISMALIANGSYSRVRDCPNTNFDQMITRMLDGSVEVLTARQKYRISIMDGTTPVVLSCDREPTNGNLVCKDAQNLTWGFIPG